MRDFLDNHPQSLGKHSFQSKTNIKLQTLLDNIPKNEFVFIFQPRNDTKIYVALGVHESIKNIADSKERMYGGLAFPARKESSEWEKWKQGRWVIPKLEWLIDSNKINIHIRDAEGSKEIIEKIRSVQETKEPTDWERINDEPSFQAWDKSINKALENIRNKTLDKIVLARKTTLQGISSDNPMKKVVPEHPKGHVICVQQESNEQWVSLSPETLYERHDMQVQTEAVAGTSRLGDNDTLYSEKNRGEHAFVKDMIIERLSLLSEDGVHCEDTDSLNLIHIQHLWTKMNMSLREGHTDQDLIDALFPTPAVCGTPTRTALELIPSLEPFDRGLYTGIAGMISQEHTHLIVNIRSILFQNNFAYLYAGAGIVDGSNSQSEWDELESKITIFTKQLQGHVCI